MRKVIREANWNVTLTPVGPQAQPLQKEVQASDQGAAIKRAMMAFPGTQFIRVEAVAADAQAPAPTQQPMQLQQQLPTQVAGLRPLQGLRVPGQQQQQQQQQQQESIDPKGFRYPYSIRLPAQFARVLRESSPVTVDEEHGQYEVIMTTESDMREFLGRLLKHRNRGVARVILDGIKSSSHWGTGR